MLAISQDLVNSHGLISITIAREPFTMRTETTVNQSFFTSPVLRMFILSLMVIAFMFGFADQVWEKNFERLHVFFFNLCAGGFTIIYHTENEERPSLLAYLFLLLSMVYAATAFLEQYVVAAIISFTLGIIVEIVRIKHFSFIPRDLIPLKISVVDKFHHASVLCLSLGLFIATFVLLNTTALHWIENKNLTLNVFFLGYSFPVSLITMSVMFSFIRRDIGPNLRLLKQLFFWTINLGVITFFLVILYEMETAKFIIGNILFLAVIMMFLFFLFLGIKVQQKYFLLSGMIFLVFTGITGVGYILLADYPGYYEQYSRLLLSCHAYLSLYGWGLSGLLILIRWNDFPLKLNSMKIIGFQWFVVAISAPLGETNMMLAIISSIAFCLFLHFFFEEAGSRPLPEKS